jgi:hypothetical protein
VNWPSTKHAAAKQRVNSSGTGGLLPVMGCRFAGNANEPVGHYTGKAPQALISTMIWRECGRMPLILPTGGGLCSRIAQKEAPAVLARVYYDTAASPFLYKPPFMKKWSDPVRQDSFWQ